MKKNLIMVIALLALLGCASNKGTAEKPLDGRCGIISVSEEWFKDLMKTAAKEGMASVDSTACPCYETITCEGETYCYAHKCPDGSIEKVPW